MGQEFSNIAIVAVILKSFCKPFLADLETYPTSEGILKHVRDMASNEGNEEVVEMCDWIKRTNLIETFFPR